MTLQEAEVQAAASKQYLLSLYRQRNELNRQIADAEEDNETFQRILSILAQRGRREALPLVKVSAEEIEACKETLIDGSVYEKETEDQWKGNTATIATPTI